MSLELDNSLKLTMISFSSLLKLNHLDTNKLLKTV